MTFDERLIELVREKEFLYNTKVIQYRNSDLKELEWNRIAIELSSTAERCKKRWASLRDRYKRVIKHGIGDGSGSAKKWKYFDLLSFISVTNIKESNSIIEHFEYEDAITADTIIEMDEEPISSECKVKRNDLTDYFSGFAEEAKNPVSKQPGGTAAATPVDATDEFFNYLAKRVKAANLTSLQEMRIEAAILNFTVEKLYEAQNEM